MVDYFDQYFDKMNTMNKESAKAQMDFQERMSSSAHVREVQDLIKAGLNPVLSANNGASSPMGAYANVDNSAVSAKFARQNLERELANQRTIAAMNNENAMKIAMAQIASSYQLGVYQSNNAKEASIYNSDMQKILKEMDIENPNTFTAAAIRFLSGLSDSSTGADNPKDLGNKFLNLLIKGGTYRNVPDMMKINSAAAAEDITKWFNFNRNSAKIRQSANIAYKNALKDGKTKQQARALAASVYQRYGRNVPTRYLTT